MLAPITLFTYARPDHTQRTVEALLGNPAVNEHDLIVYSDAPRTPDKAQAVTAVREYLHTITGFKILKDRHLNLPLTKPAPVFTQSSARSPQPAITPG